MNKIFISIFFAFVSVSSVVFAAESLDYVGENIVTVNLNIRSSSEMGENVIGMLNQGDTVRVEAVVDGWCKIPFGSYTEAYVACSFLNPNGSSSLEVVVQPVATDSNSVEAGVNFASEDSIKNVLNWLSSPDGNSYVDDSYWSANQKAQMWSSDAKIGEFRFEYSPLKKQYCSMVFVSESRPNEIFKAWCYDIENFGVETIVLKSRKVRESFVLPKLLLVDFVPAILNDQKVMSDLKVYFPIEDVRVFFSLGKTSDDSLQWKANFFDTKERYFTVSADAQVVPPVLETGRGYVPFI